jgi:hypothetical protein
MIQPWLKKGIINGSKFLGIFSLIMIVWALIIAISNNLGISPGWSMLAFIVIAVFSASIDVERQKYLYENRNKETDD